MKDFYARKTDSNNAAAKHDLKKDRCRPWGVVEEIYRIPAKMKAHKSSRHASSIFRVYLRGDGTFPNNPECPLLIYKDAFRGTPEEASSLLSLNGWTLPWAWGVFKYHHYHSTAWEVLLCIKGTADIQFGGPSGPTCTVGVGDLILIPPGVAHKQVKEEGNFTLLGSYPKEQNGDGVDTLRGKPTKEQQNNIFECPIPVADPLFGLDVTPYGRSLEVLF